MNKSAYDVCTVGNALVDIIADATDSFLIQQNIAKGGMTLVDQTRADLLYSLIGPAIEMSGGSAANTAAGISSLGGHPAYMGKTNTDQFGTIFRHDLKAQGVYFATNPVSDTLATGRCIILVTPDAQRSMNTYLGAAVEFSSADIDKEVIKNSSITYLEGYLFDKPLAQEAFGYAARIAKSNNNLISLTLSDVFCVDRHRSQFMEFIKRDVDILFANKNEILSLFQSNDLEGLVPSIQSLCKIAVITLSENGALIIDGTNVNSVPAKKVSKVVDTTGAGDLFAAGFLYGLTHGRSSIESGHIGAMAAGEVISHYGPRPQTILATLI